MDTTRRARHGGSLGAGCTIAGLLFSAYAGWVIWRQSFIALDGQRYFTIADDALITLRYGWQMSRGHGLVWNPGERVEGITSTLWALQAGSLSLVLDRRLVPLAVQLASIAWMLLTADRTRAVAHRALRADEASGGHPYLELLAFLIPLSYWPLVYWSLRGMETSMNAALVAVGVSFLLGTRMRTALLGSLVLGLACLTRPDTVLACAVIFAYRFATARRDGRTGRDTLLELVPWLGVVGLTAASRIAYYGSVTPNTYTLKMAGLNAVERIALNGMGYITPFVEASWPLFALVALSMLRRPSPEKLLLASLPVTMIAYCVYVGGDAFPNWRFVAPYTHYALLVLILDLPRLVRSVHERLPRLPVVGTRIAIYGLVSVFVLFGARPAPWSDYVDVFRHPQSDDVGNINTAIHLNTMLGPDDSVGVFYAGSIPYYTGLYAVDFLGKCDPRIAALPPDTSGAVSWLGMASVPGHNKYDLTYSILDRRPTYIQGLQWGRQQVFEGANRLYEPVPIDFRTQSDFDDHVLLLRRDRKHPVGTTGMTRTTR